MSSFAYAQSVCDGLRGTEALDAGTKHLEQAESTKKAHLYKQAIACFRISRKTKELHADSYFLIGYVYQQLGQKEQAFLAFLKAKDSPSIDQELLVENIEPNLREVALALAHGPNGEVQCTYAKYLTYTYPQSPEGIEAASIAKEACGAGVVAQLQEPAVENKPTPRKSRLSQREEAELFGWSLVIAGGASLITGIVFVNKASDAEDKANSAYLFYLEAKNAQDATAQREFVEEQDSLQSTFYPLGYTMLGIGAVGLGWGIWQLTSSDRAPWRDASTSTELETYIQLSPKDASLMVELPW